MSNDAVARHHAIPEEDRTHEKASWSHTATGRCYRIGEKLVAGQLRANGYTVTEGTSQPGSTDLQATKGKHTYLVQVKTAVHPNKPAFLNSDEARNLKSRATKLGYSARLARVTLNPDGQQRGKTILSKL